MFSSLLPKDAPVTIGLMALCGLGYLIQGATQQQFTRWGILYGPEVAIGGWWRVVSTAFVHGGGLHLLLNMGLLFALGQQLEQAIGSVRFALVYAGSIAAASLIVIVFANTQPTLGASGAVMGVAVALGVAMLLFSRSNRHQSLLILVVMNLAIPLVIPGISFWAHFGGAIGGLIMIGVLVVLPHFVRMKQIKSGSVYTAERNPIAKQSVSAGVVLVLLMFIGSVVLA